MKLKILGFDIEVIYQDDMAREFERTGHYDPVKSVIKIDGSLNKQEQDRILVHEILEVLERSLYLELDHDKQINKLDCGLYQVLRDNPCVMELICK